MAADFQKELLSSLVSDIKNYSGSDPLRPWLHGIRRMKESLPPHILKEKLPRFLQKCAQTFESDRKYRNDSRYLRVWIELMDYVDDAKEILRKMEKNQIGLKRAMFYSAYALYYEKQKQFEEAEKMYHLGVQNLAEPVDELQKSYEQFLHRLMLYKKRKAKLQEAITNGGRPTSKYMHQGCNVSEQKGTEESRELIPSNRHMVMPDGISQQSLSNTGPANHHKLVENINPTERCSNPVEDNCTGSTNCKDEFLVSTTVKISEHRGNTALDLDRPTPFCSDDTVVVKFVDSAIVGKSDAEDACHHGLVDPTVNMKEAMNAISSMFREPLEPEPVRRSHQSKLKANQQNSGFEVYIDESSEDWPNLCHQKPKSDQNCSKKPPNLQSHKQHKPLSSDMSKKSVETGLQKPLFGAFKILADDDEDDECDDKNDEGSNMNLEELEQPALPLNASVFLNPNYLNFGSCDDLNMMSSGLKEDTVIRRFVGSTIVGEPEVENACHHGLVDPTINLKEAMDDINNMFGKPINFVRGEKPKKKRGNVSINQKPADHGFSILADDDLEEESKGKGLSNIPCNLGKESDLFEPTIFTKEAMAEINEMFGKPLDF